MAGQVLVTPPSFEPITLAEAKVQCRIDPDMTEEDSLLQGLIRAARTEIEAKTNRALMTQTWNFALNAWPKNRSIELPYPPLQAVNSISYQVGNETILLPSSAYRVSTISVPGKIVLIDGFSWPTDKLVEVDGIQIEFIAGWNSAEAVPEPIKLAMKLLIGHWYENREEVSVGAGLSMTQIPFGVASLISDYRVWEF
jgi:uncharacterized phiE125 gp8 family phage protein